MAFLGEINTEELPVSDRGDFQPLPPGWYTARITECTVKQTRDGTGSYLNMRYDVLGPSHEGRVIFGRVTLQNRNDTAVRIGRENLGSILRALGLARIEDSDELIGGELDVKVKTKPASGDYEAQSEPCGWRAVGGGSAAPGTTPAPAAQQQATSAPAAVAAKAAPPWARK